MLIDLSSWYKSSLAPKIELILSCIEGSTVIDFTYFSPKGESKRTIEPYDLVFQWSSWYAWGWYLQRQEFRLFKLNRMTQIKSGARYEKRAVPIPDLSSEKVFPNKYQVKALISLEYEWRLVEEYGRDSFTKQPDGRLLFSFGFADHDNIISWILTFGNEAELLEPLEFRKELFEIGKRMQELYAHS